MGMRVRARRLLINFLFGMSRVTFALVVVGCITTGFLLGMIAFAQPSKMGFIVRDVMKESNWAEWVGAIGTWVIGWGAWKYARANLQHLVNERDAQQARQREATRNRLSHMITTTRRGHTAINTLNAFAGLPVPRQTTNALAEALETIIIALRKIEWSEAERDCIAGSLITPFSKFDLSLSFYSERSKRLLRQLRRQRVKRVSQGQLLYVAHLSRLADDVRTRADVLVEHLIAARST